jgi:translocation and assembly module TamB
MIDIRRARGGLQASEGRLEVERLSVDSDRGQFTLHGVYLPRERYRTDLIATAVLPAATGRTPPRLGLVARGDVARLDVALAGRAPAPLRATLVLRGEPDPRWHLRAQANDFDPALLLGGEPGTPFAFDLRADGLGGRADVQGYVKQGELRADIRPSHLRLDDRVLTVEPLIVDALDGRTTLHGYADLRNPDRERLRFAINARGLRWGGTADAPAVQGDADFGIAGRPDACARRHGTRDAAQPAGTHARGHAGCEGRCALVAVAGVGTGSDACGLRSRLFRARVAGKHRGSLDHARQRTTQGRLRRDARCPVPARDAAEAAAGCARDAGTAWQ